jgi:agarase
MIRVRVLLCLLIALLGSGAPLARASGAPSWVGGAFPVAARGLAQSSAAAAPPPRDGAGYYGVEQRGERWWLTTPAGDPFFSVGVDYVSPVGIPAADGTNPYRAVMEAKYGAPVDQAAWARDAGARLAAWGFNTVGAFSAGARGRLAGLPDTPQLYPLHQGVIPAIRAATGARESYPIVVVDPDDRYDFHRLFVDVYHPSFEREVGRYFAAQLPARAADPTLIGYFLDNELPFWYRPTGQGRGGATLADTYIALGPDAAGKQAWVELLRARYGGDVGALNAAWGAGYGAFDELLGVAAVPGETPAQRADKAAFLEALADRYFGTLATQFRRHDPHHLILGCRFVAIDTVPSGFGIETPPEVLRAAGRHQDVASINYYIFGSEPADQRRQRMRARYAEFAAGTGRPILNGEFSFAARDSGMPNTRALGEVVETQEERAARYADFARFTAEIPEAVGLHWWAYLDPPRQGSANGGEDGNQGLVNNDDIPYAALTGTMAALNPQLAAIHAASTGATLPPAPSPSSPSGATCFAETGRCVAPDFLAYWRAHGGLAINGFPISDEFVETLEDGKPYTVQYFERVRMERHPENGPPYNILLGQFGRRIHPAEPPVAAIPGAAYFPETGHNVTRPEFVAYWQANGGLAQFGFPLTEELTERLEDGKEYRVQYFERARFEWHPENGPPYNVLLGQFGRRVYESR